MHYAGTTATDQICSMCVSRSRWWLGSVLPCCSAAPSGHDSSVFYISNVALSRLGVTIILFCFAPNTEMLCPSSEQNHLPGWWERCVPPSHRHPAEPSSVINKTATHSSCLEPSSQSSFIRRTDLHNGLVYKAGNEPSRRQKFHNHGEGP